MLQPFSILFVLLLAACNGAYNRQPEIPLNLTASGSGETARDNSIVLSWDESKSAEVYYVYRGEDEEPQQSEDFYIGNSASTAYIDNTALDELVDYYYSISAANIYGNKETALSDSAVGWIKRKTWLLKGAFIQDAVALQTEVSENGSIWYCYKEADGSLKAGYLTAEAETEESSDDADGDAAPAVIWSYSFDNFSSDIGSVSSNPSGKGFDVSVFGGTLYIAYSDASDSDKVKVKSLSVEESEEGVLTWTLDNVGASVSLTAAQSSPRIASSADLVEAGAVLAVGWTEGDNLKLSRFWTGSSLVWEEQDLSELEADIVPAIDGTKTSVEPLFVNLRLTASISLLEEPLIAVYQLNNSGTIWNPVGDKLNPAGTLYNSTMLDFDGGRIFMGVQLDQEIDFYVFDESWLTVTAGFTGSANSLSWDFRGGSLGFLDGSGDLRTKELSYTEGEWVDASWEDLGRNSTDATKEGLVTSASAESVQRSNSGTLNYIFWVSGGKGEWAVLE